jgi:glutamine amidotransferase
MKDIVGLVDYGKAGNCHSVEKALVRAGANVQIVRNAADLAKVDKIVLPGVGSFVDGVAELKEKGLFEHLQRDIPNKPTLGICLGMQILSNLGYEYVKTEGLGVLHAEVRQVVCNAPTPHMGFNNISVQKHNPLLHGIEDEQFYFMHSFEVINYTDVLALSSYGEHQFISAVSKKNIFGVQFHPEKSREAGIQLFKNFVNL